MKIQYFKSAWEDIKHSPGWFGKLCLLALVNFIPIFGAIVTYGYLYGWAREIAWGAHAPMPSRLISNEDGKFWRRGWWIFLLCLIFNLIPFIIAIIAASIETSTNVMTWYGIYSVQDPVLNVISNGLSCIALLLGLFICMFLWIAAMRVSIYDRFSAGFQFKKLWVMFRHDPKGLLRILGMCLLWALIVGVITAIVFFVVIFFIIFISVGSWISAGYALDGYSMANEAQSVSMLVQLVLSAGLIGFILIVALIFWCNLCSMFITALTVRALGYWTMQFDVARWGGQDDPLPFELEEVPVSDRPTIPTPVAGNQNQTSPSAASMSQTSPSATMSPTSSASPMSSQTFSDTPSVVPGGANSTQAQSTTMNQSSEAPSAPVVQPSDVNDYFDSTLAAQAAERLDSNQAATAVRAIREAQNDGVDLSRGLEVAEGLDEQAATQEAAEQDITIAFGGDKDEQSFYVTSEEVASLESLDTPVSNPDTKNDEQ